MGQVLSSSFEDFRYDSYSSGKCVAVVFSSQKDQLFNYNYNFTYPLFTEMWVNSLEVSAYRPLSYAFELAASATHRTQRARCAVPANRKSFEDGGVDLDSVCLQQPYFFDPTGLLDDWIIIPDER